MTVNKKKQQGFTLLELLLALAIFMIVLGSIYGTFLTQQKSYLVQEQIADVQQNLRAGMAIMERYIRMAGYDLTTNAGAGFSFSAGNRNGAASDDNGVNGINDTITFTHVMFEDDNIDNDNNGQTDESTELRTITFDYDAANEELDIIIDNTRNTICENIEYVQFQYLDQNNNLLTGPALGGGQNIRAVRIAMLARSRPETPDYDYTDTNVYNDLSGNPLSPDPTVANPNCRRRMLTVMVRCRNISWP